MVLSGEGSEAFADSEIQNMIQSHIKNLVAENIDEQVSKFVDYKDLLHINRAKSVPTDRSIFLIINYINILSIFD